MTPLSDFVQVKDINLSRWPFLLIRAMTGIAGMSDSASPPGVLAAAALLGLEGSVLGPLLSAFLAAIFFCSFSMASLLCFGDRDCHTKDGISSGLLLPLYLRVLNPSAL